MNYCLIKLSNQHNLFFLSKFKQLATQVPLYRKMLAQRLACTGPMRQAFYSFVHLYCYMYGISCESKGKLYNNVKMHFTVTIMYNIPLTSTSIGKPL